MDISIIIQVVTFAAFLSFTSYLTYRRKNNYTKKLKRKQAILV